MEKDLLEKYDPSALEKEIQEYWESKKTADQVKDAKKGGRNYYIVHPPDKVRDDISLSIMFKSILYDTWSKYQLMNNYNVRIAYGYNFFNNDVQDRFLQKKGIDNLKRLENTGDKDFTNQWKTVSNELKEEYRRKIRGFRTWDDNDIEYNVSDKEFIDSVWWTVKELYEKDLFSSREREVWICKECDKQYPKEDFSEETITEYEHLVRIPVKSGENRFIYVLIRDLLSLLTPSGIAVSSEGRYSVISYEKDGVEEKVLALKSQLDDIINRIGIDDYRKLNVLPGSKLRGLEFVNPLKNYTKHRKKIKQQMQGEVFALDDIKEENFKLITPGVTKNWKSYIEKMKTSSDNIKGEISYVLNPDEELGKNIKYRGEKDCLIEELNEVIENDLKKSGYILDSKEIKRKLNSCPECSEELGLDVVEEWSMDTESLKENIKETAKNTNWIPEWVSPLEDFNSLEDIPDWEILCPKMIGIPFPIWRCSCGEVKIISSIDELKNLTDEDINKLIFPYWIKNLNIECDECEGTMNWVEKSIHHKFIKSISTWTQLGYPQNQQNYQNWWPGDISYGKFMDEDDMIFGNLAISNILFGEASTKKFATMGNIKGDVDISGLDSFIGYDSLRTNLLKDSPPWEDREIEEKYFSEPNKSIKVLWNMFSFYKNMKEYLSEDDSKSYEEFKNSFYENTAIEDKFILSVLQDIIQETEEHYETHRFDEIVSLFKEFVIHNIAQWYIGVIRRRINKGDEHDKLAITATLETVLDTLTRMIAPIAPFISEKIYLDINPNSISVFEANRCKIKEKFKDENIVKWKDIIGEIADDILDLKKEMDLPLKWKLPKVVIDVSNHTDMNYFQDFKHILKNRAKVKEIEIVEPGEEWDGLILTVEANRNAIGKTYRQWASRIALLLENRDAEEMKKKIEEGEYVIGIEGHQTEIQPEMVTFKKEIPEGHIQYEYDDFSIYIDYEISEDIWNEQIAKEIQLRIKSMRYEFDLDIEDELNISIHPPDEFIEAINIHKEEILDFVGGRNIKILDEEVKDAEYVVEWEINGEPVDIGIDPLYKIKMLEIYESIPGMNRELSEKLYEEGYTSLDKLKDVPAGDISDIEGFKRSLARRIVQTIKEKGEKLENGEIEKEQLKSSLDKEKEIFNGKLQKIKGIGKSTAGRITNEGYHSFEDIADSSIEELMEIRYMDEKTAQRLIDYSKRKHKSGVKKEDLEEKEPKETIKDKIEEKKGEGIEQEEIEGEEKEREEKELGEVATEDETITELPEDIYKSSTYMITDKDIEKSFELFQEILETGMKGMCIAREYPKKIKKKYGLEGVNVVWLSNVDRENAVRPKNLEKLSLKLENFLASGSGVILLNGLEYLTTNNDFRTVLHLLQSLKDQVAITESILLIPINSKALEDYQLDLIESEMDEIIDR